MLVSSLEILPTPGGMQGLREMCHDMRQPVASTFALAAAALAEPGLPQAARARLTQIVEQAEWLADLIQHSLYPAGPGACRTDLLRVVHEAVAAECVTWAGEVRIVSQAESVFTVARPVPCRRMVANLLSNATRAAGPSGMVTVEVSHQQNSALLAVEDTGPGFGKIERGLGLGLPAVSRDAIGCGGRLAYGCGAGGGARVSLWLPLTLGQTRAGGAEEQVSQLGEHHRRGRVRSSTWGAHPSRGDGAGLIGLGESG